MARVQGSEQEFLAIARYRPWQRVRHFLYLTFFILCVAVGGYYIGSVDSLAQVKALSSERDALHMQLEDAEHTISSLSQRMSVLEKGGEVDRKATDGIRQTVKELKAQIATLEEEVAFYKGIMAPGGNDKGLRVSKIDLTPGAESSRYRYSIMLTQVVDNSSYITGLAAVNIVGIRNGERLVLPLRDFDPVVTELGVKFRFRYFQELTGELNLPADFAPQQIQVVLQSTGDKAQRVEQTSNWPQ